MTEIGLLALSWNVIEVECVTIRYLLLS